jgi:hypothetical protein
MSGEEVIDEPWLPDGKRAAVCFTIDDVHPGTSKHAYEAGGDLERGALGHVAWLLDRQPQLQVTLFVTADWREISPVPTRKLLQRVPGVRERVMLARIHPRGTLRLDRHPAFVEYLGQLPRTELGLHGLHHVHPGPSLTVEFQDRSESECRDRLEEALRIFEAAGLPRPTGMTPPGWDAPPLLLKAMARLGFHYVASARDIVTPISPEATTRMSGMRDVSLIRPQPVADGALLHIPSNFQATSTLERAREIVQAGGLVAVKGHIVKNAMGHIALDGIDREYCAFLDQLFRALDEEFGDSLWWCSMGELAARSARSEAA